MQTSQVQPVFKVQQDIHLILTIQVIQVIHHLKLQDILDILRMDIPDQSMILRIRVLQVKYI
ncbi:MAG: hypothetical protein EBV73_05440 [Rhodocyclales bacterium]|nr:hypothetical protein [Rhodocyclales bacterium]